MQPGAFLLGQHGPGGHAILRPAAPPRPEADAVQREAYSHECISHGFWPGGSWFGKDINDPIYYSYTVPEPLGLRDVAIRPEQARFDTEMAEFVMKYDVVRQSPSPRETLMEFLRARTKPGRLRRNGIGPHWNAPGDPRLEVPVEAHDRPAIRHRRRTSIAR